MQLSMKFSYCLSENAGLRHLDATNIHGNIPYGHQQPIIYYTSSRHTTPRPLNSHCHEGGNEGQLMKFSHIERII